MGVVRRLVGANPTLGRNQGTARGLVVGFTIYLERLPGIGRSRYSACVVRFALRSM